MSEPTRQPEGLSGLPENAEPAIKQALKKFKDSVEAGNKLTLDQLLDGIKSDLQISDERWAQVKKEVKGKLETAILGETKEGLALDNFAKTGAIAGAEAAAKDPVKADKIQQKVAGIMDKLPGDKNGWKSTISNLISKWLGPDFGKLVLGILGLEKKEPPTAAAAPNAPSNQPAEQPPAAAAAAEQKKAPETVTDEKKYARLFQDKGWNLETDKFDENLKTLTDRKVNIEELITASSGENSNFKKLVDAIKAAMPSEVFKMRLADILFHNMKEDDFKPIIAVIKNEKTEYNLDKTPAKIREFLDKANKAIGTTELATVIASYKKTA
jgi:hypothetical protein